jgi:tetratricopeptide (TPR) repeat protein
VDFQVKHCVTAGIIVAVLAAPIGAWFSSGNSGFPGEYLASFSGGARGLALGLAQTALDGQAQSIYANPAGIASLWWQEASFSVTPLFAQGNFTSVMYGVPFHGNNVVGLGVVRLGSGDAEKTNGLGENTGIFSDQETTIMLAYGRKISESLYGGMNLKFVSQDMDTLSEKGVGADAGLLYYAAPGHVWAINLLNIIPPRLGPDTFPVVPKFGFRHELLHNRLYFSGDIYPAGTVLQWAGGMEYRWPEWFHWRGGINTKQASAGFGISTRQMDLDYALIYHPLDFMHAFTLTVRYGFAPSEAELKVHRQWDDLAEEKLRYEEMKKKEKETIHAEIGRLGREMKVSVLFFKARRQFDARKYAAARKILEGILANDPGHDAARQLLEEIRVQEDSTATHLRLETCERAYLDGRYGEAQAASRAVLDLQPDNQKARVWGFLSRAHLFIADKKFNDAKGELIEIIKIDPANDEANQLLKRLQNVLDINIQQQ